MTVDGEFFCVFREPVSFCLWNFSVAVLHFLQLGIFLLLNLAFHAGTIAYLCILISPAPPTFMPFSEACRFDQQQNFSRSPFLPRRSQPQLFSFCGFSPLQIVNSFLLSSLSFGFEVSTGFDE